MVASLRIELFPVDLRRTVPFYVEVLRFEVVRDDRPLDTYLALRRGSVELGLSERSEAAPGSRRPPHGAELVLEVDDVAAERDHVADRAELDEDLTERPWGLTDFRVLDPDGSYWRVTGRAGPGARS